MLHVYLMLHENLEMPRKTEVRKEEFLAAEEACTGYLIWLSPAIKSAGETLTALGSQQRRLNFCVHRAEGTAGGERKKAATDRQHSAWLFNCTHAPRVKFFLFVGLRLFASRRNRIDLGQSDTVLFISFLFPTFCSFCLCSPCARLIVFLFLLNCRGSTGGGGGVC